MLSEEEISQIQSMVLDGIECTLVRPSTATKQPYASTDYIDRAVAEESDIRRRSLGACILFSKLYLSHSIICPTQDPFCHRRARLKTRNLPSICLQSVIRKICVRLRRAKLGHESTNIDLSCRRVYLSSLLKLKYPDSYLCHRLYYLLVISASLATARLSRSGSEVSTVTGDSVYRSLSDTY
jgi:hypothetical protein